MPKVLTYSCVTCGTRNVLKNNERFSEKRCVHCGAPFLPTITERYVQQAAPPKKRTQNGGVGGVLLGSTLLLAVIAVAFLFDNSDLPGQEAQPTTTVSPPSVSLLQHYRMLHGSSFSNSSDAELSKAIYEAGEYAERGLTLEQFRHAANSLLVVDREILRTPNSDSASPVLLTAPKFAVENALLPPVVTVAPGIVFNRTGDRGLAPFQIITAPGQNYFVKLVDATTYEDRLGVFVRGGEPVEVAVPLGRYRMRYASGVNWYGEDHLFGPGNRTSYAQSATLFSFERGPSGFNGFTVELIQQTGGNMSTRPIAADEF